MAVRVKGERFLHIHRQGADVNPLQPLVPGLEIETGGAINPFFRLFEKTRTIRNPNPDGSESEITPVQFMRWCREGLLDVPNARLAKVAYDSTRHFVFLARELIMEDVRREIEIGLPSRRTCFWATPEEMLPYWRERLHGSVVSIEVDGIVHKADASFLLGDSEPLSVTYERARRYWRGETGRTPQWEYLIEGRIKVMSVVAL